MIRKGQLPDCRVLPRLPKAPTTVAPGYPAKKHLLVGRATSAFIRFRRDKPRAPLFADIHHRTSGGQRTARSIRAVEGVPAAFHPTSARQAALARQAGVQVRPKNHQPRTTRATFTILFLKFFRVFGVFRG